VLEVAVEEDFSEGDLHGDKDPVPAGMTCNKEKGLTR
jgi:hypothetical protein